MSLNTLAFITLSLMLWLSGCGEANHTATGSTGVDALYQAWQQQRSNIQVSGSGIVTRVLPDDIKGSRHQRFILKISGQQTLLIAHNIDLAPRLANLRKGDTVEFNGEYEWNTQGGVVHWTHKDPQGRHPNGWLRHHGQQYW